MKSPNEQKFLHSKGRLEQWPNKQTEKLLVLSYLASKFQHHMTYSEQQVNNLLKERHTFGDWPLLRRELFDRGFLDRDPDGSNYRLTRIGTGLADLWLVRPNIDQDAPLAVGWLAGEAGRETLKLMGNTNEQNKPSTLEQEKERMRDFVTSADKITWMINYAGKTIGAIWIDLQASQYLQAPSIHIMIGDPLARGKGIGENAIRALTSQLERQGNHYQLFSRHLVHNAGARALLKKCGFATDGAAYEGDDGLKWQNVKLELNQLD